MGRWLPDANGPGEWGDQRPCCELSPESGRDEAVTFPSLLGDPGLEGKGEAPGNGDCCVGESVKRKIRGSSCQKEV